MIRKSCAFLLALAQGAGAIGQSSAPAPPAGLAVVHGTDKDSGIEYALISLDGTLLAADKRPPTEQPQPAPRLTAQCTRDPHGRLRFELLADFGAVAEVRYIAPFKATDYDLFPPLIERFDMTMEFLGYTRVKPVKRQWAAIFGLPGEWTYATPSLSSPNMEEAMFYLQYLKALPKLRLTRNGLHPMTLEFDTAPWLARVKADPLCHASGL